MNLKLNDFKKYIDKYKKKNEKIYCSNLLLKIINRLIENKNENWNIPTIVEWLFHSSPLRVEIFILLN